MSADTPSTPQSGLSRSSLAENGHPRLIPTTSAPTTTTPVSRRRAAGTWRVSRLVLPTVRRNRQREQRDRDARTRRALLAADVLAAAVAFAATTAISSSASLRVSSLAVLAVFPALALAAGLYSRDELLVRKTTLDEAPTLLAVAALATLGVWQAQELVVRGGFGRHEVLLLAALLLVTSVLSRRTARLLAARGAAPERCLFIGGAPAFERLRGTLAGRGDGVELLARLAPQRLVDDSDGDETINFRALAGLVDRLGVHRVIVSGQAASHATTLELMRAAKSLGVRVSLLPQIFEVIGHAVAFDDLYGVTLLGVRPFGLTRNQARAKRTLDVLGSALLLVFLAPLQAALAALVRLDSRGPALFRQARVGRDGERFAMLKFRTMVPDAEERKGELLAHNEAAPGLFKIADDPRITRVGGLLRRTSLDELPQLLNVLRGDMSLVGPRPLVLDEDEHIVGWDRRRLHLKPGMTGQWQIFGSSRIGLSEMVKIDYLYVANWSLWNDVKILLRTIPYVLARRGQ